ncbi:MAG: serine protease [Gloeomargarita sp. GMQP_bins_120]
MKVRYWWLGWLALLLGGGLWQWHRSASSSPLDTLTQQAREITVQVRVGASGGSGVLLARRDQIYTVVTNQHVLDSDPQATRYSVRTPDGQWHSVRARPPIPTTTDVALLEFTSAQSYSLACPQPRLPQVGDPVFAAGFPFPTDEHPDPGFVMTTGHVRLILPQPLEGGYRLGYTNPIAKGMSGGPVLDQQGRLVALNGMHQPLWGSLDRYLSGETPAPHLQSQLAELNWGIPITAIWLWVTELTPSCLERPPFTVK